MSRRRRISAVLLLPLLSGALMLAGSQHPAGADHCPPNPGNPHGDSWCHRTPAPTPQPTPAPTPPPTPQPTIAPTQAPTAPPATRRPSRTSAPAAPSRTAGPAVDDAATPEPTPLDFDLDPESNPRITLNEPAFTVTPAPDETEQPLEATRASNAIGGGLWIGLIIGLVIGFLIGRASWGIQRRRKQQLFG